MEVKRKMTVLGYIQKDNKKVDRYIVMDVKTRNIHCITVCECVEFIEKGNQIVGLSYSGSGIKPTGYFRALEAVGVKDKKECKNFTVLIRYIYRDKKKYDISDAMGNTHIVDEEELNKLLDDGVKINGIKRRSSGIVLYKDIDTILVKEAKKK